MNTFCQKLATRAVRPVDNTFVVYLRVAFGMLIVWSIYKQFRFDAIYNSYVEPRVHFPYPGCDWIQPWSESGMYAHFLVTAIAACCLAVGFCYRWAALIFTASFTYIFLLDQSWYLNHHYLICLLGMVLTVIPANAAFSLDARRSPSIQSDVTPVWTLWLLRFQIGLPYFFGGLAKINPDWLRGEPMRPWLADNSEMWLIGRYFTEPWCVYLFSYGGLLLDLLAVPLLLVRRTRVPMLLLLAVFHLLNSQLFNIGIFPWLMLAATTLVFLTPEQTAHLRFWRRTTTESAWQPLRNWMVTAIGVYVMIQIVVPFRHLIYPGDVAITREGHCFSWRMKLNNRDLDVRLFAQYPDGLREEVQLQHWITYAQYQRLRNIDQVLYLAQQVRRVEEKQRGDRVEVYGSISVRLNDHPPVSLLTNEVDLSRQSRRALYARWLTVPRRGVDVANERSTASRRESQR